MWLPLTRRTCRSALMPLTRPSTSSTQGPAAFTRTRAAPVSLRRSPRPETSTTQELPSRCAAMTSVRVRISAPRSFASRALSTTSRASSTQQSEYSKASRYSSRIGASLRRGAKFEPAAAGQALAAAEMIVEEQAEPDHPGRALLRRVRQHETHRPDDVRRRRAAGPRAPSTPRAPGGIRNIRDSAGRHGSACRNASWCPRPGRPSRRAAPISPRPAASRAMPAPLMPPPMTTRSKMRSWSLIDRPSSARVARRLARQIAAHFLGGEAAA